MHTAEGVVRGWRAQLAEVAAVTITVLNVDVVVLESKAPPNMLLAMSFLPRQDWRENGAMVLSSDFQ
jgi:predicted aspartyl protease